MENERPMLILEEGMDEPQRWLLDKDVTTVGRWPDNDVVLPDRGVSRQHAHIRRVGTQLLLEDCKSTNGTFLNGERLVGGRALQDGDRIQIAPSFQLRFVDHASTTPITGVQRFNRLQINQQERQVTIGSVEVELSAAQYSLLFLLAAREGKVVSRAEIVNEVWSEEEAVGVTDQAIDALIRRLRERLAVVDADHAYIQTVRGHGFKFDNR